MESDILLANFQDEFRKLHTDLLEREVTLFEDMFHLFFSRLGKLEQFLGTRYDDFAQFQTVESPPHSPEGIETLDHTQFPEPLTLIKAEVVEMRIDNIDDILNFGTDDVNEEEVYAEGSDLSIIASSSVGHAKSRTENGDDNHDSNSDDQILDDEPYARRLKRIKAQKSANKKRKRIRKSRQICSDSDSENETEAVAIIVSVSDSSSSDPEEDHSDRENVKTFKTKPKVPLSHIKPKNGQKRYPIWECFDTVFHPKTREVLTNACRRCDSSIYANATDMKWHMVNCSKDKKVKHNKFKISDEVKLMLEQFQTNMDKKKERKAKCKTGDEGD